MNDEDGGNGDDDAYVGNDGGNDDYNHQLSCSVHSRTLTRLPHLFSLHSLS